jgi:chromosomal replication initiation ATPase DnaA
MTLPQYYAMPGIGRRVTPKRLFDTVERLYDIKPEILTSPLRDGELVRIRQSVMYILRFKTTMSLEDIANTLGRTDHTTCIHSCRKVQNAINGYDGKLLAVYENISEKMYDNY